MPGHTKKEKKKISKGVRARKRVIKKVKQIIADQRIKQTVASAANRQARLDRGQDIKKDFGPNHPINKPVSPGIRARVRNLRTHGESVPVRTHGEIDKGGPIKRTSVAFQKFKNKQSAKVTAKDKAANKRRKKKSR